MVNQISVFLENAPGSLARLTGVLGEAQVDLVALSIADTTNFGILRAIVSDTEKAIEVLKKANFTVNIAQVMACLVDDQPGGLAKILNILNGHGVSIEYLYSFVRSTGKSALIIFRPNDSEKTKEVLLAANITLLEHAQVLNF